MSNTGLRGSIATLSELEDLVKLLRSNDLNGTKASAIRNALIHIVEGTLNPASHQVAALTALLAHYDAQASAKAHYDSNVNDY